MPNYDDLIAELHSIGAVIVDADALEFKLSQSENWTAEFTKLLKIGRKEGIRIESPPDIEEMKLIRILRGYSFKAEELAVAIKNFIPLISFTQLSEDVYENGEECLVNHDDNTRKAWAAIKALESRRGFEDWLFAKTTENIRNEIFSELRFAIAHA